MPLPRPLTDWISETTTTQGLGTIFLDGPVAGLGASLVSRLGDGAQTYFCIYQEGVAWEVFLGTINAGSPDSITRDEFVSSSTGSTINFGSGVKNVYNVAPASQTLMVARALQEISDAGLAGTARGNLGAGAAGSSLFAAATAAAARSTLGLLSAALRDVGVASATQIPDRAAADARYQEAGDYQPKFPTDGSVKLAFYMASAPAGWTRETGAELHDTMIRMVTTGGGTATIAGRQGVASANTAGHALTEAELAAHGHDVTYKNLDNVATTGSFTAVSFAPVADRNKGSTTSGSGAAHLHAIRIRYADFLVARFTG